MIDDTRTVRSPRLDHRIVLDPEIMVGGKTTAVLENQTIETPAPRQGPLLIVDSLRAKYRGAPKHAVNDVSFRLDRHSMMAIVGPSGSSKSTLCHALLGEMKNVTGRVEFAGDVCKKGLPAAVVSFVPQIDNLPDQLTVYQTLQHTARLRLRAKFPAARRHKRINQLLTELELIEYQDVNVAQLSVGTRKRLSVAIELLSDPLLLILDEPTSGLDEGLDRSLMQLLKKLSETGPAVMVVTHSAANLDVADHVLALRVGGVTGFFGPPEQLLAHFDVHHLADVMKQLRNNAQVEPRTCSVPIVEPTVSLPTGRARTALRTPTLIRRQTQRLLPSGRRRWFPSLRAWLALGVHLVLVPAFVVGLATWSSVDGFATPEQALTQRIGVLISTMLVTVAFFASSLTFGDVVKDYASIRREHRWGISPAAVVFSKFMVLGAVAFIQGAIAAGWYLMVRPPPGAVGGISGEVIVLITAVALAVSAAALGLLISSLTSAIEKATVVLMAVCAGQVVLSGLLVPLADTAHWVTPYMDYLSRVLPLRWATAALAVSADYNQYLGDTTDPLWTSSTTSLMTAWVALLVLCAGYLVLAITFLTARVRKRM